MSGAVQGWGILYRGSGISIYIWAYMERLVVDWRHTLRSEWPFVIIIIIIIVVVFSGVFELQPVVPCPRNENAAEADRLCSAHSTASLFSSFLPRSREPGSYRDAPAQHTLTNFLP